MERGTAHEIMRAHARSFAPATRWLRSHDRDRIASLYAICRIVDDLADEDGSDQALQALLRIRGDVGCLEAADPVAAEAARLFDGKPRGLQAFQHLLEGVLEDLRIQCLQTEQELHDYAKAVAGTVGVMICELFDIDPKHHVAASALGCAMQYTNICRDVLEDARAGRRYLPYETCPHSPAAIAALQPEVRDDVRRAVQRVLLRADELYAQGAASYHALPFRLRLAVSTATSLYRGIGHELRRRGGDPLSGRVQLRAPRKVLLALTALPDAIVFSRPQFPVEQRHA